MSLKALVFLTVIYVASFSAREIENRKGTKQPHIIFMLADDYGWNDIGFHNPKMKTPILDRLAETGIKLNQSYVQNMCTPSRAALLTGHYPFKTGMQEFVIPNFAAMGVPLQFDLLPQKLKKRGYNTHIIGKWHLGGCAAEYSPLNRGFDSFFGYNTGGQYYYDHSNPLLSPADAISQKGTLNVYDFWNQTEVAWSYRGIYSSIPFLKQVEHVLERHDAEKPLFLYLPFQLTHSPMEVPLEKISLYDDEPNEARKIFSAMASQLDSDVGVIVDQLKKHDLYDNSIIIFTGDNGGEVRAGGNNYPLRGAKHTLYEGGHRATAFIHSPLLNKTGFTYNGLIHITDWFPTIVTLAGGRADSKLDGFNVWSAMTKNKESPRKEVVYHLEVTDGSIGGAIRIGDWKLIIGKAGLPSHAVKPNDVEGLYLKVPGGNAYFEDIDNYPEYRLFNLKDDPTENKNLAKTRPDKMYELLGRLLEYKREMVDPVWQPNDVELYKSQNCNLTYFGRKWCDTITNVNLINWDEVEAVEDGD